MCCVCLRWVLLQGTLFVSLGSASLHSAVAQSAAADLDFRSNLALPFAEDSTFVVHNPEGHYTFQYDTLYRQALWVSYLLTKEQLTSARVGRQNGFRRDPRVLLKKWPSASDRDYHGSGYDRGHLLPSGDRNHSVEANRSTFHLSNVSPQYAALNRKTWKCLEEQVRHWAIAYDSLWVVTGPVLEPGLPRIGGGVGVPSLFFKAVLVRFEGQYYAIGWLVPNLQQELGHFDHYRMSIDLLEELLGLDLFYQLPRAIQEEVESRIDVNFWQ